MTSLVESSLCTKKNNNFLSFFRTESVKKKRKKSPLVVSLCASVRTPQLRAIQPRASRATRRKRTIGRPFLRQWCGWLVSKVSRPHLPILPMHTPNSAAPPTPFTAPVALQKRFVGSFFFFFQSLVYYALSAQCSSPGAAAFHRPLLELSRHQMSH